MAAAGGMYLDVCGEEFLFLPRIASFVCDGKEADYLCGQVSSWKTAFPCRLCLVPTDALGDTDVDCELKDQAEIEAFLAPIVAVVENNVYGLVTQAENKATGASVFVSILLLFVYPY